MEPLPTPASFAPSAAVSLAPRGLPIPDGRYRLTAVAPRLLMDPAYRLERADTVGTRFDFGGRAIESFRSTLAGQHRREAVLITPEPNRDPVLGFRGLAGHQVEALRKDGFEPAWVVKVGERFDVLLRPHAALEAEDARALRDHLAKTYELPDQRGVFQNAVHLPGHAFPHAGQIHEPALVEVRAEPFSASRAIVQELQQARFRETVETLVQAVPNLGELSTLPLALAEAAPLPRPTLWVPELEVFQSEIERRARAYRLPEAQELANLSDRDLIDRALAANRQALESAGLPIRPPRELSALESEIAHRLRELIPPLQAAERDLAVAVGDIERTARQLTRASSTEALAHHRDALDRAQASVETVEALSLRHRQLTATQLALDHHRLLHSLDLNPEVSPSLMDAALAEQRWARLRELQDRTGLGASLAADPSVADSNRQYWEGERNQAREAARLALQTPAEPLSLEEAQATLKGQTATLARLGWIETHLEPVVASPAERLSAAVERVAQGDLSAETLRRLNQAIDAQERILPEPSLPSREPSHPVELEAQRRFALAQVRQLAAQAAAGRPEPATLAALVRESSHAIGLHGMAERLERERRGLPEPHPAPAGVPEVAWRAAWLHRAQAAQLCAGEARAHLANAFPSPMISGELAARLPSVELALKASSTARATLDLGRDVGLRL